MTFRLIVDRRPPSSKAGRQRFASELRLQADRARGAEPQIEGRAYIRVVWFHFRRTSQDLDNALKGIFDGLKGSWVDDDFQFAECVVTRIDVGARQFVLSGAGIDSESYDQLMQAFAEPPEALPRHLLYLEAGPAPNEVVRFGRPGE